MRRGRPGTALVIVLAVLVVVTTVLATATRQAGRLSVARNQAQARAVLEDLSRAGEQHALRWITDRGSTLVLPPDAAEPRVEILDDTWELDGWRWSIRITAWDQSGMVPLGLLTGPERGRVAAALSAAVPEAVRAAADALVSTPPRPTDGRPAPRGLDQLRLADADRAAGWRMFPGGEPGEHAAAAGTRFVVDGAGGGPGAARTAIGSGPERGLAVGAWLATHHPSRPRINLGTAPAALVVAALEAVGRDDAEAVLDARAGGSLPADLTRGAIGARAGRADADTDAGPGTPPAERAGPVRGRRLGDAATAMQRRGLGGARASRPRSSGADRELQLVTSSDAWGVRVDVTRGGLRRSWWMVFQRVAEPGRAAAWRKVQQLAIRE